ncbi:restriction endonuclease subunit S [Pseudoflavonifractor sp. An187]|uniref:restriction endonuclease subunit S n=1 Tax=Pseudoflavonifractor sp. An187 TaxID=1965578 RepID=UPI000B3A64AA|nr:restriction endonuclease subunit S [Pseudoflavonifractor sp. An187]OUP41363.1 type I restriction endonuclease subunit S [Pseudoflavonifractor sp. An187]
MASIKYKLGDLLRLHDERNSDSRYTLADVKGISIQKVFIETKADMTGVSLKPYILVKPDFFAYVTVTSRNGEKITIAHNDTENTYIVSSSYVVFEVARTDILLSDYLFIYFNRSEFDRYARFNSWGSARETFSWEDMCDIDIELPPIEIQHKYVDIYNAMLENQRCYESALEDLKLICDAYIDKLKVEIDPERIGPYLDLVDERNADLEFCADDVRGISIQKTFIPTKADMTGVSLKPYYIVSPDYFAYVTVTSRNGEKISLAYNNTERTFICSSSYVVFCINNTEKLCPGYLQIFLNRAEFDRYARFHSWGSARETFDWSEMCDVQIPIPDIKIQQYIVNIYTAYLLRKEINEQLKVQVKNVCPILIKGSLEEAENGQNI